MNMYGMRRSRHWLRYGCIWLLLSSPMMSSAASCCSMVVFMLVSWFFSICCIEKSIFCAIRFVMCCDVWLLLGRCSIGRIFFLVFLFSFVFAFLLFLLFYLLSLCVDLGLCEAFWLSEYVGF